MKTYLKEWMDYRKIDAVQLADKTKVSEKMISKYLSGKPTPSLQDAALFADVLETTIDALVNMSPIVMEEFEEDMVQETDVIPMSSITTSNFTEVVRFRNYCIANNIDIDIVVNINSEYEDTPSYTINYDDLIDIASIAKICKKKKYSDKKLEKMTCDNPYEGMTVIRTGESSTN